MLKALKQFNIMAVYVHITMNKKILNSFILASLLLVKVNKQPSKLP